MLALVLSRQYLGRARALISLFDLLQSGTDKEDLKGT
jgi:hypothetical protein